MSTIKTNAILDASGGNTTTINGTTPTAYNTMGKNLIINGAMEIAQRGTSSSGLTSGAYRTVDRVKSSVNRNELIFTEEQSTDAPAGFFNSFKYTVTTAETTVDANDFFQIEYHIEGHNTQQLDWGTSDAKTITLSFWAKSSSTGVFPVTISNSGGDRHYPTSYTINSANTWEKKEITVTGSTSGTWLTGTNIGVSLRIGCALGSTYTGATANQWLNSSGFANAFVTQTNNVMTTTNATWQITGLQLEVGSVATEFERRPYTTELQLCQRYYEKSYNIGTVPGTNTTTGIAGYIVMANSTTSLANNGTNAVVFKVYKRTTPTITTYDSVGNSGKLSYAPAGIGRQDNITSGVHRQAEGGFGVYTTSASSLTAGQAVEQFHQWTADAEL